LQKLQIYTKFTEKFEAEVETERKDIRTPFKPGFQIRLIGEYALNSTFRIQSGILFSTQDGKEIASSYLKIFIRIAIKSQSPHIGGL
jgi:hypothetical protein